MFVSIWKEESTSSKFPNYLILRVAILIKALVNLRISELFIGFFCSLEVFLVKLNIIWH